LAGDNGETGFWAALSSGAVVGLGILWSIWAKITDRHQAEHEARSQDRVRANLDRKQELLLNRMERLLGEAQKDAELWERRARRADAVAHDLRHLLMGLLQKAPGGKAALNSIPARVPLLEDPFDEE